MYPILLQPIYKKMIWGGEKLKTKYGRDIPFDTTGESWDVSCRENEMSVIENGALAGKTFIEAINTDRLAFLGERLCEQDVFPLLVKIIDAKDDLSIQVHPGDLYARLHEKDFFGKTEMWYILDAEEGDFLIIGLNDGVSREMLSDALNCGDAEKYFGKLPVKKGDLINIPSGLIHAITKGIMLAEIQQNSDITYRVFDYNRLGFDGKPRELHVEKALDVADFEGRLRKETTNGLKIEGEGYSVTYAIANRYFAIEKHDITGYENANADGTKFCIYTCVSGEATFETAGEVTVVGESRSVFIPAAMGEYKISGCCTLLKSYVPGDNKGIEDDFLLPLKQAGFTDGQISENCAVELE